MDALAFKKSDFSSDLSSSSSWSSNLFDSPFEDTDISNLSSNDDADLANTDDSGFFSLDNAGLADKPVQLVDFSSSEASPFIGRSRIRRRDGAEFCNDPGTTDPFKSQAVPDSDKLNGLPVMPGPGQSLDSMRGLSLTERMIRKGTTFVKKLRSGPYPGEFVMNPPPTRLRSRRAFHRFLQIRKGLYIHRLSWIHARLVSSLRSQIPKLFFLRQSKSLRCFIRFCSICFF